jgi:hypothetical protein
MFDFVGLCWGGTVVFIDVVDLVCVCIVRACKYEFSVFDYFDAIFVEDGDATVVCHLPD